ncbi:unnamed protein product, partial [Didymodactylos carnosus]
NSELWTITRSSLLLTINSLLSLIVAIYLVIFSAPSMWNVLIKDELWFYCFHLGPTVFAQLMWTANHPARSLPKQKIIDKDISHTLDISNALIEI